CVQRIKVKTTLGRLLHLLRLPGPLVGCDKVSASFGSRGRHIPEFLERGNLLLVVAEGLLRFREFLPIDRIGRVSVEKIAKTFDNPPLKQLQDKYKFTPSPQWLDHVRLSSVRFNDGGSGSFVSANGLVITNHHVAFGQIQKLSTPQKNYVQDGFRARNQAEE